MSDAKVGLNGRLAAVAAIAKELGQLHFPRGDLAALRRMNPAAPGDCPAFFRTVAEHLPELLDGDRADELRRFALIAHGMALMTPDLHRSPERVGASLFGPQERALVSEQRLARLLTARGAAFASQVPRIARHLRSKSQALDWEEFARLILAESRDEPRAERCRERIAAEYYRRRARHALRSGKSDTEENTR